MATDRISFRAGDARFTKLMQYKEDHKIENRELRTTDIMIKAIDMLLENEDGVKGEIRKYEDIIIKMLTGTNRKEFETDEEYLERLKITLQSFSNILKTN